MIKSGKTIGTAVMMLALFAALGACQKKEGPIEQAGKKVDQAADRAGQEIEKAGNKIQDATQGDRK